MYGIKRYISLSKFCRSRISWLSQYRMDGILGGVDACQGDSGGPLWVEWDGRATQVVENRKKLILGKAG